MKIKAVLESSVAGAISAVLCYFSLISPTTVAAIAIRRKMPEAWFSSLIVWYATVVVIGVSIIIAVIAYRMVYKHIMRSTSKP